MICSGCGEEYNEEMFQVCPFCLKPNEDNRYQENVEIDRNKEVLLNDKNENKVKCEENYNAETIVENYATLNYDYNRKLRIEDAFIENKYNLFLKYCEDNSIKYVDELYDFDFHKLASVKGIGVEKINDIISRYKFISKNEDELLRVERISNQEFTSEILFENINEELMEVNILILQVLGIKLRTVNLLIKNGYIKIGHLKNMRITTLVNIVGSRNLDKFVVLKDILQKSILEVFESALENLADDDSEFNLVIKRADGYTLQEIGVEVGLTRERVRQIVRKFNEKIESFMLVIIDYFMKSKKYITVQQLLEIYNKDEFNKIIIYWCQSCNNLEYLGFANVFVKARQNKNSTEQDILKIVEEFIGEGINLYDNLEELESILQDAGYVYIDEGALLNLLEKYGYRLYGDFVSKGRQSYAYLCAKIVAKRFPTGIKLYEGKELDLLRKYSLEQYGELGIPNDNRAFSSRLSSYLILSGRGSVIAAENIEVEMSILEDIKEYIDDLPEAEVYYSEIYSRFEGVLNMMSNIDNYHFLHGVLKLYYPKDYDFSNRDYLKKKGNGYKSGKFSTKLKDFIRENGKPVHKKDIKNNFPGISDIVLINALNSDTELFQWEYNYYYLTSLIDVSDEMKGKLSDKINQILDSNKGYCNDNLLFNEIKYNYSEFIIKNHISTANNLYFLCAKLFADKYDFKRPHIANKGIFKKMSVKNIALFFLGYPDVLYYSEYNKVAQKMMWSDVTSGNVFYEIEKEYFRISDSTYIKEEQFVLSEELFKSIEVIIRRNMKYGIFSLINYCDFDEFPDIGYEWNVFLLHSIIEKYIKSLKIIETRTKDRRYERGIIVDINTSFIDYSGLVVDFLKKKNLSQVSESSMLSLLIMNDLTYKMIPKELYASEKIIYKDNKFIIRI